jgi:hypothetical protein
MDETGENGREKKILLVEPISSYLNRKKELKKYFLIGIVLSIIAILLTLLFNFTFLPEEPIVSYVVFEILFLLSITIIPAMYYSRSSKRFVVYENGLYTNNKKNFIQFKDMKYFKIDDTLGKTIYLNIINSEKQEELYQLWYKDFKEIRKILLKKGIIEKEPFNTHIKI